uniref:Uncharacterized protein n=1 Tax=Ditylenchus dipsaci TaxID=166011 RepID=A0A915D6N6_9BILA
MSSPAVISVKSAGIETVYKNIPCSSSSLTQKAKDIIPSSRPITSNDQLLEPPNLGMVEYKDLMNTLDKFKRRQLWNAIRKYTIDSHYDDLVEQLGTLCLPDHPLVFSGFFGFVRTEEDKHRFRKLCNRLNLLTPLR